MSSNPTADFTPTFPSEEARKRFLGALANTIDISYQARVRARLSHLALRCGAQGDWWETQRKDAGAPDLLCAARAFLSTWRDSDAFDSGRMSDDMARALADFEAAIDGAGAPR